MHVSKQVPGPCPAPGPAASPQALGHPAPLLLSPTPLLSEKQERKKNDTQEKKNNRDVQLDLFFRRYIHGEISFRMLFSSYSLVVEASQLFTL